MSFSYISNLESIAQQDDFIIYFPESLNSKESLLNEFSKKALFPDYFSMNWDSFEECLRDLSWIKQKRLIIIHKHLPLLNSKKNLKIYLEILNDASTYWKLYEPHELLIIFPTSLKESIETALNK